MMEVVPFSGPGRTSLRRTMALIRAGQALARREPSAPAMMAAAVRDAVESAALAGHGAVQAELTHRGADGSETTARLTFLLPR